MASLPKPRFTPEQYLALEREAETKSEYFDGEIFAMSGASRQHNLISVNVIAELRAQLKGRPCEVYGSDMRVKVDPTGLYTYPDVVVCGEVRLEDEHLDTLLNPTVLIEVLSPTTEAYDRGKKFAHYRRLDSLTDYLLIAQDQPRIEHYARQADQKWVLSEASELCASLPLTSLGCTLALAEVYDRVTFAADKKPEQEEGS
jgi:Uma2 family endonuclease